jgi:hypothetical protein
VLHAKVLHRYFFDSHTLPNWTGLTEIELRRIHFDEDYHS